MAEFIYLASQSPRRRQLLEQIGVRYELLLPAPHEDSEALEATRFGESARAYVQRVTRAKLDAALPRLEHAAQGAAPVLCADTTVAIGREILGKPADAAEARRMLQALSGREHRVLTAVAVGSVAAGQGARVRLLLSESIVRFAPMSAQQIAAYVASGEPMGKAGAYAIQSGAAAWVSNIRGSYSGIMGLPLYETAQLLREFAVAV
jgi:septum formation protein